MHLHTVDYRKDPPRRRGTLANRGFWLTLPRPLITCRLLGHRPVVDGYGPHRDGLHAARWVTCDRCGERPNPQGRLDVATWNVGDRYTGPWLTETPPPPSRADIRQWAREGGKPAAAPQPGPWPADSSGVLGGQLIIGRSFPGAGIEFKLGNAGSEHTLAGNIRLYPLGALYLHTERFGTWWQRRLNPVGYESRVTGLTVDAYGLHWKLWAKRDETSSSDPWWQHGTLVLDPRDRLLGRRHYAYDNVGEPVTLTVRMPHGDDHQVTVQLQRCTHGRRRHRRFHSWCADWTCREGIPTKPGDRGTVHGSAETVTTQAVTDGAWQAEAAARIALRLTSNRASNGYTPSPGAHPTAGASR